MIIINILLPLFVSVGFHQDHKTFIKLRLVWPPSVFGDIARFKTVVSIYLLLMYFHVLIISLFNTDIAHP